MALTYDQRKKLAIEQAFKDKVIAALIANADDVIAEVQTAMVGLDYGGRTEAEARTALAFRVMYNSSGVADDITYYIAGQIGETGRTWDEGTESVLDFILSITDNQYRNFVGNRWSELARWRLKDTP